MASRDRLARILVIDDRKATLAALKAVLAPLPCEIVLADNTEKGLSLAASDEMALVITDVRMPRIDGLKLLARVHVHANAKRAPVVFLGERGYDSDEARRAYELGAVDYIQRPIDPDIFRAKIHVLVTLFQQAREIERRDRAIRTRERETIEAVTTTVSAVAQTTLAEEAVRAKDRTIGVLGHDLRNPLAAIMVGLQMLMRSETLSDRERARVLRISGTAERMHGMIRDLLEYAKTSAGGFPYHPVETDLRSLCDATIEELRALHADRTITLEVRGDLTGRWDPDRLKQALVNLIGNAIEHGSDGPVDIRLEGSAGEVVVAVHNDGDPIPPSVVPVLFEPFRRGDGTPHGLGLGLYIVREIIRSHGGAIEVRSSAREGTTFISHWPRGESKPASAPS